MTFAPSRRATSVILLAALLLALVPAAAFAAPVNATGMPALADPYDLGDGAPAGARDVTALLGAWDGAHGWGKAAYEETHTLYGAGTLDGFDEDWFRVDVDTDTADFGLVYLLEAHSTQPGVHPAIEVYGPCETDTVSASDAAAIGPGHMDGSAIAGSQESPWSLRDSGLTSVTFRPAEPGSYFFRVRPFSDPATAPGLYTLRLKVGLVTRLAGNNRFSTSTLISREGFPDGSLSSSEASSVVLASGSKFPDALAGSLLAGVLRAPLLLTRPGSLDASVTAELKRLGAQRVFLLGGTTTLTGQVVSDIHSKVAPSVEVVRIEGRDRTATAAEIALRARAEHGAGLSRLAFVCNGWSFPDALAASPMSASAHAPILLTHKGSLDASVTAAIDALGITDVVILGQTSSVDTPVENALKAKLNGDGKQHVKRIGGTSRYATAAMFAKWATGSTGATTSVGTEANPNLVEALDWTTFALATGTDFPDALGGGAFAGESGAFKSVDLYDHPLLLTSRAGVSEWIVDAHGALPAGSAFLTFEETATPGWVGNVQRCYVYGGPSTISDDVVRTFDSYIGYPLEDR